MAATLVRSELPVRAGWTTGPRMNSTPSALSVVTIDMNSVKLWGLTMGERVGRIARASKLSPVAEAPAGPAILSNAAHATSSPSRAWC